MSAMVNLNGGMSETFKFIGESTRGGLLRPICFQLLETNSPHVTKKVIAKGRLKGLSSMGEGRNKASHYTLMMLQLWSRG